MLVLDVHEKEARLAEMTLLAEGLTVLGISSQDLPKGTKRWIIGEKRAVHGAIP